MFFVHTRGIFLSKKKIQLHSSFKSINSFQCFATSQDPPPAPIQKSNIMTEGRIFKKIIKKLFPRGGAALKAVAELRALFWWANLRHFGGRT